MSYISKKDREIIRQKYAGYCAYSGTLLKDDWQVDHMHPVIRHPFTGEMMFPEMHTMENLVPCQKIINHYKGSLGLELFRTWFLGEMHLRLAKLPKNPKTEKSKKKIEYIRTIAAYFRITETQPFSGRFFFEY